MNRSAIEERFSKHHPEGTCDRAGDHTPSQSLCGNSSRGRLSRACGARRASRLGRGVGGGRDLRGVERAEGFDLEFLGGGVDVSEVNRVDEENGPSCAGRLAGLILGDDDGAVEVLLDGDDGHRRDEDLRIGVVD